MNNNESIAKVNDSYMNAKESLQEAMNFLERLIRIQQCFQPYAKAVEAKPLLTKAAYMQATVKTLMQSCRLNFEITYPHLQQHSIDGDGIPHAAAKLVSAIVGLEAIMESLKECDFIIKSDEERNELDLSITGVIRNMLLYIKTQYRLVREAKAIYLPAYLYCESVGVDYYTFLSKIEHLVERYNAEFYIYEVDSAEAEQFSSSFQEIYQEAENARYPLTVGMAMELLENPEQAVRLQADLDAFIRSTEVISVKTSPGEVLKRMNLE